MNNSISASLWRILWRERAFRWLEEERLFRERDRDACIEILSRNPASREAAFALFWGTYLGNEWPPVVEDNQIEGVKRLLDFTPESATVGDIQNVAFVKLHLAGFLAICLIRPEYPACENPSIVKILEKAIQAYRLANPPELDLDDPKKWGKELAEKDLFGFSMTLINGIIRVELASIYTSNMKYEDALSCIAEGAWDICATTIEQTSEYSPETKKMQFHDDCFSPYLPHSDLPFDIQEAADIFEEIKRHARIINDWNNIKLYCDVLKYLGYCELYNFLDDIADSSGEEFGAVEYWGKAITFAEERMQIASSSFPILTREAQERAELEERLKRDFLADSWRELPEESTKILVDAEVAWTHNRVDNMIREIRPFLEILLPSIFPFLRTSTGERGDPRLPLTIMRDDLKGNRMVQASIHGIKMKEKDKQWIITSLPDFLNDVIQLRNYFEKEKHRQKIPQKEQAMRDKAIAIRRQLLGIGCEGILPRLIRIKQGILSGE